MSINGFDFPKVTLRQLFQSTGSGTVDELGVVCIGPVYRYADGGGLLATEYDKADGLAISFAEKDWVTGAVDADDAKLSVKQGVWQYKTLSTGFSVDESDNRVTLGTIKYDDRDLQAGDYLAMYQTGETNPTVFPITDIVYDDADKVYKISYRDDDAASELVPVKLGLCLAYDATIDIASTSFTSSNGKVTGVLISSAIKVAHDATTWHSEDLELVGMTGQSNCGIYVQFRVPNADYDSAYGAVSTASEVMDVLGPISTKNPVALGCYCAIAGGAGTVYFIGAVQDSIPAYQKALDYLDRYNNMYSIVPCTENQAVISACAGKVGEISDNIESKVWRTLWYGISCTARTNDGKITGTTLEDNAVNQVPELLKKRVTNTLRAQCVWADDAYINGESLDGSNYALAAAAAGMRAGQPCHRPLSNLGYSFFTIKEKHGFSRSQLKQLGANGIWIIANNEDGAPINMRQVTTAVANNLNEDEESIVANADNIAINMANIGRELVGCSNISPDLLLALEATIRARMDAKTVNTYGAYIGPQIISWELVKPPYQDPVNLDHVLAEFSITPPRPFNQLHMTLIVL